TVTGEQVRRPGPIKPDAKAVKAAIAAGEDPDKLPWQRGTANIDATNSTPKSVSVAWMRASQEHRREIERAVLVSAHKALEHMTQTKLVAVRDEKAEDGSRMRVHEPAVGMAAALALHVTARRAEGEAVPSPQLHVHGVLVGVERADGVLVTPDSRAFFKDDA